MLFWLLYNCFYMEKINVFHWHNIHLWSILNSACFHILIYYFDDTNKNVMLPLNRCDFIYMQNRFYAFIWCSTKKGTIKHSSLKIQKSYSLCSTFWIIILYPIGYKIIIKAAHTILARTQTTTTSNAKAHPHINL